MRGRVVLRQLQTALLVLSALLCAALSVCYAARWDGVAAVTLWPPWLWLAPGVLITALGWSRSGRRWVAGVAGLWLLFLLGFEEEPRSLARLRAWPAPGWKAARQRGEALRVISLNCAGGSAEAAAEVAGYRPDIVLLQESPGRRDIERLARRLFGEEGGVAWGLDASILARGRVSPVPLPRSVRMFVVHARVRLTSGIETEVISLRHLPPTVRMDLWSPACWRE